jgi:hypothetical protein
VAQTNDLAVMIVALLDCNLSDHFLISVQLFMDTLPTPDSGYKGLLYNVSLAQKGAVSR